MDISPPIRVTDLLHPMLRARPSGFPLAPEIVARPANGTPFVLMDWWDPH
jgi:hypothetical protein